MNNFEQHHDFLLVIDLNNDFRTDPNICQKEIGPRGAKYIADKYVVVRSFVRLFFLSFFSSLMN